MQGAPDVGFEAGPVAVVVSEMGVPLPKSVHEALQLRAGAQLPAAVVPVGVPPPSWPPAPEPRLPAPEPRPAVPASKTLLVDVAQAVAAAQASASKAWIFRIPVVLGSFKVSPVGPLGAADLPLWMI
jgi:hypothetical protein